MLQRYLASRAGRKKHGQVLTSEEVKTWEVPPFDSFLGPLAPVEVEWCVVWGALPHVLAVVILFYFILFYFILFYFILFYFILLFNLILFYFISFHLPCHAACRILVP